MMTSPDDAMPPRVEKWIWSTDDFEDMGWHDNYIHAFGVEEREADEVLYDLLFDIDYIVEWLYPPVTSTIQFWICPATLVFHAVEHLDVTHNDLVNFIDEMQILELDRDDEQESVVGSRITWRWTVGPFSFRASGFTQYLRRPPIFSGSQWLAEEARGGMSLALTVPDGSV